MAVNTGIYSQGSRYLFKQEGEDLTIKHVPTGKQVVFPAFLDLFSDSFSSQWNAEDVYGRMDPIATFMSTRRALSVAWWVPADSFEHAEENLAKANKLMSFLYPLYDNPGKGSGGATVINQGPLMRISFGNLMRNSKTGRGLLGYVNGFTFDPALEYGMFNRKKVRTSSFKDVSSNNPQNNEYYPKTYRLNFEFVVLHEHELGYRKTKSGVYTYNSRALNAGNFPYHTGKTDTGKDFRAPRGENSPKITIKSKQPPPASKTPPSKDTNTVERAQAQTVLTSGGTGGSHRTGGGGGGGGRPYDGSEGSNM